MAGRYPNIAESDNKNVVAFPGEAKSNEISDQEAKKIALKSRPRGMSKEEQKVWASDIPAYIQINRFKPHFIRFFKEYCIVVARMEATKASLDVTGWQYKTTGRNGEQFKNQPGVAQYNDDWRKLSSLISQLGGSPATDKRFNSLQRDLFEDVYD